MRRPIALAVAVACAALWPTGAGGGIDGSHDPRPGVSVVGGVPEAVVVWSGSGSSVRVATGGSGGSWSCAYYRHTMGDWVTQPEGFGEAIAPAEGEFVLLRCVDASGAEVHAEALYYEAGNPVGSVAAGWRAAQIARERLALVAPVVGVSPPAGGFQLVGVASWFWLESGWEPAVAEATLAGVVSRVTATPVELTVDTGDGNTVSCGGPGRRWEPGVGDSECAWTYRWSSRHAPGGIYRVVATVVFEVSWEASTGEGGTLEGLFSTGEVELVVQEAQAVIR